jgi:hypothetical protein
MLLFAALLFVPQIVNAQPMPYWAMPFYSQWNGPWANTGLGYSQERIADYGCLLTSCAMLDRACGAPCDPGSLNQWLKQCGGFSGDLIVLSRAGTFGGRTYAGWLGSSNLTSAAALRNLYAQRGMVIAWSGRYLYLRQNHYVLIVGFTNFGLNWTDWIYFDPSDPQVVYHRVGDGWVNPGTSIQVFRY